MPIKLKTKGNFKQTIKYLNSSCNILDVSLKEIKKICEETIEKLSQVSPCDSIANSWSYEIVKNKKSVTIFFNNSVTKNGLNLALLLDKGHATRNGSWVQGKDFIDEPIDECYNKIINKTKEELNKL
jgi:hypothetical protein